MLETLILRDMKKTLLLPILATFLAVGQSVAQTGAEKTVKFTEKEKKALMNKEWFEEVFETVSPKKTSIITLKDGKTYKGYCRDVDRNKGQIYDIEIEDSVTGQKMEFKSEQIAEMYLYPSGFERAGKMSDYFGKVNKWGGET